MRLSEYKALQMRDPDFREAYEKSASWRRYLREMLSKGGTMRRRNYAEMRKWYMSAVKAELILHCGLSEEEAAEAICDYDLEERIDRCFDIVMHDEPAHIAQIIYQECCKMAEEEFYAPRVIEADELIKRLEELGRLDRAALLKRGQAEAEKAGVQNVQEYAAWYADVFELQYAKGCALEAQLLRDQLLARGEDALAAEISGDILPLGAVFSPYLLAWEE